jgi:hypothetical protein
VDRAKLRTVAEKKLIDLAAATGTDPAYRVFILGPYDPPTTLDLLVAVRDLLRGRFHYLAFLEKDVDLEVDLQDTCRELFDISQFGLFVVTDDGISRGWQFELADLAALPGRPLERVGFFYESFDALQGPVKDFLANHLIRHAETIRPAKLDRTLQGLVQVVNSFFLGVG